MPLTMAHYLRNMSKLTDQYFETETNYKDKDRQRIYLKDIDPPPVWTDKLREQIPPNLFYFNDSTGAFGGPGAVDEKLPGGGVRRSRGIAPAGDLMSSLPQSMRAENLQCYIGHEGTYTPAHREMCATLGHNIMVENSNLIGDDGRPEKPGSSIWFMTETKDRQTVSEYWLSILGHDIEVEKHFAQIAAWKKAPFTVYVCEQQAGDFLLIPPLAPHQVWNRGTRTMKVAWNRTTVETLEMAIHEALPKARMVCRDEQYKNKAIVYYTLIKYASLLNKARDLARTAPSPDEQNALRNGSKIRQVRKDFKRLFNLFKEILLSEMFGPDTSERNVQYLPFDGNVTCAYCRSNVFNRFLSCPHCDHALGTEQPEPYDICMDCYAMGRSCACISKYRWVEQFKWKDLVARYETWRRLYLDIDNGEVTDKTPLSLPEERQRHKKDTLAQICQKQLKRRPWVDIHKPPSESEGSETESEQIEYGADGTVKKKKRKKKRTEAWLKNTKPCHVCAHRHPRWKMAECPCGRCWCYGTLFRGHDIMPQQVMEDPAWECPHCQGICSAGNCRKGSQQTPYQPKGTLLGHDTRAVADVRSVESLVDFSVSNLNWLKENAETPAENARLRKKQQEAELSKLDDTGLNGHHYATEDDAHGIEYSGGAVDPSLTHNHEETSFIDPSLLGDSAEHEGLPVTGLFDRENDSIDLADGEDEQATTQNDYVAPSAVMYGADQVPVENAGRKRKLTAEELAAVKARLQAKAARREGGTVSGATKQYRRDHEKRVLEEAKRSGRFIQVSAALKGKTKLIRLGISSSRLRHFRDGIQAPSNEIVASDVQRTNQAAPAAGSGSAKSSKVKSKAVIRNERDDDFATRRRGGKRKHDWARDVEEIDVPSDPNDDEEAFGEQQVEGALDFEGGRKRRRISQWQANRAAEAGDDAEEPENSVDALQRKTPNFTRTKNGKFAKNNNKLGSSIQKTAGKGLLGLRPISQSQGQANGGLQEISSASEDEDVDNGDEGDDVQMATRAVNMSSTAAAALDQANSAEENRRAKLAAGGLFEQGEARTGDSGSNADDDGLFVKQVASSLREADSGGSGPKNDKGQGVVGKPAPTEGAGSKSIFAKRGLGGRKIRIVGSRKKVA